MGTAYTYVMGLAGQGRISECLNGNYRKFRDL